MHTVPLPVDHVTAYADSEYKTEAISKCLIVTANLYNLIQPVVQSIRRGDNISV
jgi:hypothetical protein